MKITVVTVCYNAEKVIEDTIKSVLGQTYKDVEYILIDGLSTDCTVDIIKSYAEQNHIRWISEKDHGIYDAMNKGVNLAHGEYLYFLNAGDVFYNEQVLENLSRKTNTGRKEVLYGDIVYIYPNQEEKIRSYGKSCGTLIYNLTGDCINHQAVLASRDCFDTHPFKNEEYQICADRVWMIQLQKEKVPFVCTSELICKYSLDEGSMSIRNKVKYNEESKRCVKEYLRWGYGIFFLFEFMRNNKILSIALHTVYKIMYMKEKH